VEELGNASGGDEEGVTEVAFRSCRIRGLRRLWAITPSNTPSLPSLPSSNTPTLHQSRIPSSFRKGLQTFRETRSEAEVLRSNDFRLFRLW
jgi:hypothetical protein